MKYRKSVVDAIIQSIQNGATVMQACEAAGIDPRTFYRWRKKYKEVEELYEMALDSRVQIVEDSLFKRAVEGNVTAIIFFLMNRAPDRWKDRHELSVQADEKVRFAGVELPDYLKPKNEDPSQE